MTIKWLQMAENPKNLHQNVRNLHFVIEATLQPPGQVLGHHLTFKTNFKKKDSFLFEFIDCYHSCEVARRKFLPPAKNE